MSIVIKPQPGPQEKFLSSSADIVVYGGAAGGGKTYSLLMEPLRHMDVPGFTCTIFRKNATQITIDGGLLDESISIYGNLESAEMRVTPRPHWTFNKCARVSFMHIDCDADLNKYQGSQICLIGFDELTHFTENSFFYMMSRNRSTCGVRPYIRATCNPDCDSWVARLIAWWIDQHTGYPIKERDGVIRYFYRVGGDIIWGDTKAEVKAQVPDADKISEVAGVPFEDLCKSMTFIASSVYDNKELLKVNPEYLASLNALPLVERERFLNGNWKIRPAAGLYFRREQTTIVKSVPGKLMYVVRSWDLAATESTAENKDPDRTAGVLMGRLDNGQYIVLDVKRYAVNASTVRQMVLSTAATDKATYNCRLTSLPQDPGQAGKEQAQSYVRMLAGYNVKTLPVSGDKIVRAEPFAAQWQQGNILLLEGVWNDTYIEELEGFPDAPHDDQVDASSDAFKLCIGGNASAPPGAGVLARASYWT